MRGEGKRKRQPNPQQRQGEEETMLEKPQRDPLQRGGRRQMGVQRHAFWEKADGAQREALGQERRQGGSWWTFPISSIEDTYISWKRQQEGDGLEREKRVQGSTVKQGLRGEQAVTEQPQSPFEKPSTEYRVGQSRSSGQVGGTACTSFSCLSFSFCPSPALPSSHHPVLPSFFLL